MNNDTAPTYLDAINANIITKTSYGLFAAAAITDYFIGSNDPASLQHGVNASYTLAHIGTGLTRGGISTYETMQQVHEWRQTYGDESLVRHGLPKIVKTSPCARMGALDQVKREGLEDKIREMNT